MRLFIRGERFPEGKLSKEKHLAYLAQTIEFLFNNENVSELIKVNSRSFFTILSEIFLNKHVVGVLLTLNKAPEDRLHLKTTHMDIIEKYKQISSNSTSLKHIKFEYFYWIIKIAIAEIYTNDPESLVELVFESINYVLKEIFDFQAKDKSNEENIPDEEKYIGPNDTKIEIIEQEILDILPFYTQYMQQEQLRIIIEISRDLKIDRLRIHIYEEQKDFEGCIQTYLTSDGCKTEDVFLWLRKVHKKKDKLEKESIDRIQREILRVINDLIITDSIKTSEVIDQWLPNQQMEIIDKLSSDEKLQLKYLTDFINEREEEIRDKMMAAARGRKTTTDFNDYTYFLKLHIKLLVKLDPKKLDIKDYYPVD